MSLDWDITKVKNSKEIKTDEEWPITEGLIFLTMNIGIREITEENCREFLTRIRVVERVYGPTFSRSTENGPEPRPVTLLDLQRRVGLITNASKLTKIQFLKNLSNVLYDNIEREISYEEKKAA